MNVIVTTVIRNTVIGEQISGRIIKLDWEKGIILKEKEIVSPLYPQSNKNPRGGLRGGRGIKVWEDRYYVANYDSIYIYDKDLNIIKSLSHKIIADIHEIDINSKGIWVSCSRSDLVVKLDFDGKLIDHWHISYSKDLQDILKIKAKPISLNIDYRKEGIPSYMDQTHLNSVQYYQDDSLIIDLGLVKPNTVDQVLKKEIKKYINKLEKINILNGSNIISKAISKIFNTEKYSYIIKLNLYDKTEFSVMVKYPANRPNHNGLLLSNNKVVLAAESQNLIIFSSDNGKILRKINVPGNWLRGLAEINEEKLLVGKGPAGVVEVNYHKNEIIKELQLSTNPHESIHGIAIEE